MTSASHMRKGWCPGALRPMESGDGLLLRVRPQAGACPISALAVIAKTASLFGSGEIDLTNRANLQLRGVLGGDVSRSHRRPSTRPGLIDDEAGAEAVRNVVVDPLAGADTDRADVRPLALRLESALVGDRAFREFPQKFGFSFGSGDPMIGGRSADIMVSAPVAGHLAISLDAAPGMGALVPPDQVVDAVHRLAAVFLELRVSDAALSA